MRIYYELLAQRKINEYDTLGEPVKILIECEDYPEEPINSLLTNEMKVISAVEIA